MVKKIQIALRTDSTTLVFLDSTDFHTTRKIKFICYLSFISYLLISCDYFVTSYRAACIACNTA